MLLIDDGIMFYSCTDANLLRASTCKQRILTEQLSGCMREIYARYKALLLLIKLNEISHNVPNVTTKIIIAEVVHFCQPDGRYLS